MQPTKVDDIEQDPSEEPVIKSLTRKKPNRIRCTSVVNFTMVLQPLCIVVKTSPDYLYIRRKLHTR